MTPDVLAEIHAACFSVPRPWNAAEFAALLASEEVFLIAESQGFLLGQVVVDEAEILTLAIHPVARRARIATRLLDRFRVAALARGATTVFLEVAADNQPALALYRNAGFKQAALRKAYYAVPGGVSVDAAMLTLELG